MAYKRTYKRRTTSRRTGSYVPSNRVRFASNTYYLKDTENSSKAPCRLYYSDTDMNGQPSKPYWEGRLLLSNGQILFISIGGSFSEGTSEKGGRYITCNATLSMNKG